MNKKYIVIALFGESGAGKDTIQDLLWSSPYLNANKIISYTTRPKRDYEEDGIHYHFISEEDFNKKLENDNVLEYAEFRKWKYGTFFDCLKEDKINLGVFNIQGVQNLLNNPNIYCFPIYVSAKPKERLLRSLNREANPDCQEICRRFLTDLEDFSDLESKIT